MEKVIKIVFWSKIKGFCITGDASFGPFNISEQEKLEWAFKDDYKR